MRICLTISNPWHASLPYNLFSNNYTCACQLRHVCEGIARGWELRATFLQSQMINQHYHIIAKVQRSNNSTKSKIFPPLVFSTIVISLRFLVTGIVPSTLAFGKVFPPPLLTSHPASNGCFNPSHPFAANSVASSLSAATFAGDFHFVTGVIEGMGRDEEQVMGFDPSGFDAEKKCLHSAGILHCRQKKTGLNTMIHIDARMSWISKNQAENRPPFPKATDNVQSPKFEFRVFNRTISSTVHAVIWKQITKKKKSHHLGKRTDYILLN